MVSRKLIPFLAFILGFYPSPSQEYSIDLFTSNDGLPGSEIYAVLQDHKGFLWLGTYGGGISRYDGFSFVNYGTKDGLPDNRVQCLFEDSKHNIWIGTYGGGAACFDGKKFTVYNTGNGLKSNIVYSIAEDKENTIWLATYGGGISLFKGNGFSNLNEKDGLSSNNIWSVMCSKEGTVWIGSEGGLSSYAQGKINNYQREKGQGFSVVWTVAEDSKGNIWLGTYGNGAFRYDGKSFENYSEKEGLGSVVYTICEDNSGQLWFGTDAMGVQVFDGKFFSPVTEKNNLSHNRVRKIIQDREGIMWIGTDGGLNKYYGKAFTKYGMRDGLGDNKVLSILADHKGDYWFGTFGGGVSKITFSEDRPGEPQEISIMDKSNGLPSNRVWKIFEDSKKRIWLGTSEGVVMTEGTVKKHYSRSNGLPNNMIYAIMEDSAGNMWIGSDGGVSVYDGKTFKNYTAEDGLSHNRVRCIQQDKQGNLWLGTYAGGVTKFDGSSFAPLTEEKLLKEATVYCLTIDYMGSLWFGTYGNGIVKFNPSVPEGNANRFEYFTAEDGIGSDAILSLNIDKAGFLWVGTNTGVASIDLDAYYKNNKRVIQRYGKTEGFRGIECHQNAVFTDALNNTWFGTISGAIKFTPVQEVETGVVPKTMLTGLKLFYGEKDIAQFTDSMHAGNGFPSELRLPFDQNHLTFEFVAISLLNPEKVRYKFRLLNFDEEWSPVTNVSNATYSNLPPGEYTFELIAAGENGLWNRQPATYSFTILKPFWQQWWFYFTIGVALSLFIWLCIYVRTRSILRTNIFLDSQVKVQTEELVKKNLEKEILLKEIHHRVKNNLQLISSLLNLQAGTVTDTRTLEAITECKNRVTAMALIHRKLYQADDFAHIEFRQYVENLVEYIVETYEKPGINIEPLIEVDDIQFDVDITIPMGLILNELLSNSFKYAFTGKTSGKIIIRLTKDSTGKHTFVYSDSGKGLPPSFNIQDSPTLGMMLVQLLSDQLKGKLSYEYRDGARFTLVF